MLGATGFLSDFVKDELMCRGLSVQDFGGEIDNEQNESILEIFHDEEGLITKPDQKVLFITTDSWLAQLGSRKNN